MLSKRQLLQAIVGLIEVSDYGLLRQDAVLREMADFADFPRIREIARTIKSFYDGFDYTRSEEYRASIHGKAPAFKEVSRRMASDAKKAASHRARLCKSFLELPGTDSLRRLLPLDAVADIDKLARAVEGLRNPD